MPLAAAAELPVTAGPRGVAVRFVDIDGAGRVRMAFRAPQRASIGTCIIVQSGQVGAFDQPCQETELYRRLEQSLARRGVGTVRFDMTPRDRPALPASSAHKTARATRVFGIVQEALSDRTWHPVVLFGMSLGGEAVLKVASSPSFADCDACGIIVVGYVVEEPITLASPVSSASFVYGAANHIALLDENGEVTESACPFQYGCESVSNVTLSSGRVPSLHILSGLGHLLSPVGGDRRDPAALLTELVVEATSAGGHFRRSKAE
jgi:hypothetical protein